MDQPEENKQFSQLSPSKRRGYRRAGLKYSDPIWMLMRNPLFAGKINTLLIQSKEKWDDLEMKKLSQSPFYKVVPCPVTLNALTWISAYLKYYFLEQEDDRSTDSKPNLLGSSRALGDLERMFNILLNRHQGSIEADTETEMWGIRGV